MKVLLERHPYRFCEGDERGFIEKFNDGTRRWTHMYECDSRLQLMTAMEDINYCRWLDPAGVPCYREQRGDVVKSPYRN
jgi:hypothetical protein